MIEHHKENIYIFAIYIYASCFSLPFLRWLKYRNRLVRDNISRCELLWKFASFAMVTVRLIQRRIINESFVMSYINRIAGFNVDRSMSSNLDRENQSPSLILDCLQIINLKWNKISIDSNENEYLSLPLSFRFQVKDRGISSLPPRREGLRNEICRGGGGEREKLSRYQPAIVTPEARAIL